MLHRDARNLHVRLEEGEGCRITPLPNFLMEIAARAIGLGENMQEYRRVSNAIGGPGEQQSARQAGHKPKDILLHSHYFPG